MKAEFNKNWKSSKQPRKQRKYLANAPQHLKRKQLGANVAKSIRTTYGRTLQVRKGDEVKIMRGTFKGKTGKITEVETKNARVQIGGVQKTKKQSGEKLVTWFKTSNLLITAPDTKDNKRIKKKTTTTTENKKEEKTKQEGKKEHAQ
jgi:large subunit ribosomal protein L24